MSHGQQNVTHVRRSIMRGYWLLSLKCKHTVTVRAQTKPTRAHHFCEKCRDLRKERREIHRELIAEWGGHAR